jgi:ATP citrate (pro-S)-lyase
MDYNASVKAGLVRRPTNFISTISDDRGEELLYGNMSISEVFKKDIGIGGVLSILWFKKLLPKYATKFIEMCLMVTADHGPAVSGAHNTIVATRAGKDLISSLVSGMLTIGPRFGGAIDGAAQMFSQAFDAGKTPKQFVDEMKNKGVNIQGIGHLINQYITQI